MDDVISIVKKNQGDTFFNHLDSFDPHINLTMKSPSTDSNNPVPGHQVSL